MRRMSVSDVKWSKDSTAVSWKHDGREVLKEYSRPPQSVLPLRRGDGVAIVENDRASGPLNAAILNADGSERCRIRPPFPAELLHGFYFVFYEEVQLRAVITTTSGDWSVAVDPETGMWSDLREWR